MNTVQFESTPLPVVAAVSRVVTQVVDRVTGDRVEVPLLVAAACVEALSKLGIQSRVMYGQVAWVEILENNAVAWAGCWGENFHFWVATQYGEVVDLNVSVAHRKRSHTAPQLKGLYSPPMLWAREVPKFYRYIPEGVAELDLHEDRDKNSYSRVLEEVLNRCTPDILNQKDESNLDFPNEPILCPGRKLLDDSQKTFQHFERALGVYGIPKAPI